MGLKIIVSRVLVLVEYGSLESLVDCRKYDIWMFSDLHLSMVWTCSHPLPGLKKHGFEKLGSSSCTHAWRVRQVRVIWTRLGCPWTMSWMIPPLWLDLLGPGSHYEMCLAGYFNAFVCFWNNDCIFSLTLPLYYLWNLKSKDAQLLDSVLPFCV